MAKPRVGDISGQKHGRLTPIELIGSRSHSVYWLCSCECGNNVEVTAYRLKSGHTKSCGCLKRVHGKRHTRLYRIYRSMLNRCALPSAKEYRLYGARGITVCEEWKGSFDAFYKWAMSNGYSDNLSIDRIDNGLGYCPENCRFASSTVQVINRRTQSNNTSGVVGVKWSKKGNCWVAYIGIEYRKIHLGSHKSWFEAACARKSAENKYHKPVLERAALEADDKGVE